MDAYLVEHKGRLQARLDALHAGVTRLAAAGLPVRDIAPQGAIYLSVQFALRGRTNDEIRRYLLEQADFAVVPFQAFGLSGENGWFRLSIGAVSVRDVEEAMPRVEAALTRL
jgi:aspartate aminotransferase